MSVYLHLFHGRDRVDEDMNSWGLDGPTIGPLAYVHTTYGGDIKLRGSREVLERFFPEAEIHFHDNSGDHAIQLDGDCLPYAGKVYGDWWVCGADALRAAPDKSLTPVCDVCGSDDLVKDAAATWDNEAQAWVLLSTYDSTTCQSCEREGDTIILWRAFSETSPGAAAPATTTPDAPAEGTPS